MYDDGMLAAIDGQTLAAAFPVEYRAAALRAGIEATRLLAPRQRTKRFEVRVEGQAVLIPARLHFQPGDLALSEGDEAWRFARALQTRSNDGFERQRAARDILASIQPWAAPFIVALVGEYIVEIIDDVAAGMTPDVERILASFIFHNEALWNLTKCRVTSYWNAYYRSTYSSDVRHVYTRDEYVGFKLINQLTMAALGWGQTGLR